MNTTYRCVPQIQLQIRKSAYEGIPRQKAKCKGILAQNRNATYRCVLQIKFQIKKSTSEGIPAQKQPREVFSTQSMNTTYRCVPQITLVSRNQQMKEFLYKNYRMKGLWHKS